MITDAEEITRSRRMMIEAGERADATARALRPEIWQQLGWRPHPTQREILESTARNKVFAGGRRVGKSQTGGHTLVPYAFTALAEKAWLDDISKRREYWIVGPEYSDAEKEFRVLYNAITRLGMPFDRPGTYNNPITGEMHISLWGGSFQVHAKSAKYPNTLVGEGLSGLVISEAAKLKPSVWPKFLRPTLADFLGWSIFGSTPEGRNWFYRLWEAGQDPLRDEWKSWRSPSWTNLHLFPLGGSDATVKKVRGYMKEVAHGKASLNGSTFKDYGAEHGVDGEIVQMMLDLSEETFKQEIAAEFNEFVGRVFKDFDEEIHVGSFAYEPAWATYAALDYGFTNPFVWLLIQVDPHNENIRILDEYYEVGKTTGEAAREIIGRGLAPGALKGFYPDPAEPDRSAELASLLEIPSYGHTGGPIKDRLEWIRRKLRPDPKVAHLDPSHEEWTPGLMIHRRCKDTIRDFSAYRYPKTHEEAAERGTEAPEVPMKKDDHAPEALGRFMIGHFGSPWVETGRARQSRVNIGRRGGR